MSVDYQPDRWMSKVVLCMSDSPSSVSGICKITRFSDSDCIFWMSAESLFIRSEHIWLLVFDTVDIVDIKLGRKILFVWLKVLRRKTSDVWWSKYKYNFQVFSYTLATLGATGCWVQGKSGHTTVLQKGSSTSLWSVVS